MREMKDSGVEWIGVIPAGWKVQRAKTYFKQTNTRGNQNLVLLAATQKYGMFPQDMIEGVVKVKEDTDLQNFKTVHKGDFVISLRSFQGGFEMSDYEGVCSPAYQTFHAVKEINNGYFRYFFKSSCFIDAMNALTVGIREGKNIRYEDFANSLIIFPPLSEQTRIASYLDDKCSRIDSIIAAHELIIAKLKEYRASLITETVTRGLNPHAELKDSGVEWIGKIPAGWSVEKIKYNFNIHSGATPKSDRYEYWGGNIIWITPADYKTEDKYIEAGKKNLTEEGYKSCGTIIVPKGSIIFSKRAPVGTVAINRVPLCTNQGCLSCIPNDKVNVVYFYYTMSVFTEQFDLYSSGTTFQEISATSFANFKLPLPPLSEQTEIASYLDDKCTRIDDNIRKREILIKKLAEYKKSLIYETVTGKKEI